MPISRKTLAGSVAALALIVGAGEACAAITVTDIGTANAAAGSATLVVTTTADSPVGTEIIGVGGDTVTQNLTGVTDSAGNTYSIGAASFTNAPGRGRIFWGRVTTDLPLGGTVTLTFAATTGSKLAILTDATGLAVAPTEQDGAAFTGSGTTFSMTTNTLAQSTELLYNAVMLSSGAGDTYTEDATSTSDGSVSNLFLLHLSHKLVATSAANTYSASGNNSRTWAGNYHSFVPPGGACFRSLLHVGC